MTLRSSEGTIGRMSIPFLDTAWLGIALVVSLFSAALLPPSWRKWWVVIGLGPLTAGTLAVFQVIPWTGHLLVTAYGFFLFLAFVAAYFVMMARAHLIGVHERQIIDITIIALTAGMIGSRLFEIIDHWQAFAYEHGQAIPWARRIARMADIDGGGMVWYGGALLGATAVVVYAWRQRLRLLPLADVVLPALLAGLAIGRLGCFFNGCCFGLPTNLPWAVSAFPGPCPRHPTQLYEVLVCAGLWGICWFGWRRRRWDGQMTLGICVGYGCWRYINEILREDKVMTLCWGLFPASTAQVISVHLVLGALCMAGAVWWYWRRHPAAAQLARQVPGSIYAAKPMDS